ncbi:PREDICTED: sugar transporter ERD6-like 12 [Tarenaya hassleriana]|uniref:sugar transporter ERD6-like 12 n=1 Tax=Tarenaya hassleriana TaxID=28532 RepID=UPI00053CA1E3|nr:PREDICTED: sugar transporter ERD6-like 12 [Tarenaya hassleriana]
MEGENMERGLLAECNRGREADTKPNSTASPLVVFSTFITVCGSLTFGIALGYTADTMSSIMEDLDVSLAQYSFFGSLLTFGGMIGAIFSAKIAAIFGRKVTLWLAEIFCIIGWLAIALAKIHYVLGNFFHWRTLAILGVIPCIMQVIGLFFIPESPRWLAKEGKEKEFEIVLQRLRGKKTDISQEAREIRHSVEVSKQNSNIGLRNLFRKRYARQLTVGIGLMLLQQLSGSAGVMYYAKSIFEFAGFPSQIGMTSLSLIMVPKALLGLILVDRWGRRPLLMASAIGMCSSCIVLSVAFGVQSSPRFENLTPVLAFVGTVIYNTTFAVGLGALPWIIMSEIFPINMKVLAGSIVTMANWSTSWVITYCFNFMLQWSHTGTFTIFAVVCGMTIVFTWCLVPETKGLTLEEIQVSFANALR